MIQKSSDSVEIDFSSTIVSDFSILESRDDVYYNYEIANEVNSAVATSNLDSVSVRIYIDYGYIDSL